MPLSVAGLTCLTSQVSPPSPELATFSGVGSACPWLSLRKSAQQTYTLPKNLLEAALSAQTCSLSEKVVCDCGDTSVGALQCAPLSSVRDTAMPSKPRKDASVRTALKFEV